MDEAIAHAAAVRDALEDNQPDAATAAYKLLEASCAKCHTAYRN
jgi:cytochrome c556